MTRPLYNPQMIFLQPLQDLHKPTVDLHMTSWDLYMAYYIILYYIVTMYCYLSPHIDSHSFSFLCICDRSSEGHLICQPFHFCGNLLKTHQYNGKVTTQYHHFVDHSVPDTMVSKLSIMKCISYVIL